MKEVGIHSLTGNKYLFVYLSVKLLFIRLFISKQLTILIIITVIIFMYFLYAQICEVKSMFNLLCVVVWGVKKNLTPNHQNRIKNKNKKEMIANTHIKIWNLSKGRSLLLQPLQTKYVGHGVVTTDHHEQNAPLSCDLGNRSKV